MSRGTATIAVPTGGRQRATNRAGAALAVLSVAVVSIALEAAIGGGRGLLFGIVAIALVPTVVRAGGPRFHPLDPETYVPLCYVLSAAYAPLRRVVVYGWGSLTLADIDTLRVSLAGTVGCSLACAMLSRPMTLRPTRGAKKPRGLSAAEVASVLVGAVGMVLIGAWIASVGPSALFSSTYVNTYLLAQGFGVLTAGWMFVQFAVVCTAVQIIDRRRLGTRVPKALYGACLGLIAFFSLNAVLGRRGPLVWLAVALLLAIHLSGGKVRRVWLVLDVVLIVFYAYALQGARMAQGRGLDAQLDSAQDRLETVEDPLAVPELERVYENLVQVVNERPPIVDYPGQSWLNAPLTLVPRFIWPERPTALSQRFVRWDDPEVARRGGGLAFSATAEGYINLGLIGAFVQIAVTTALFFFGPLARLGKTTEAPVVAMILCLGSFAYNQYRAEFGALLKLSVIFVFACLLHRMLTATISSRAPHVRRTV